MPRKPKPYMVFQTKEDFEAYSDKLQKRSWDSAQTKGFKDGCVWVLSYIEELLQDMFKPQAFTEAQQEIASRHIEQWRCNKETESLKRQLDLHKLCLKVGHDYLEETSEGED